MTLPINHLKRTLDRCCGQWEFRYVSLDRFEVEFLNTLDYYVIFFDDGKWLANLTKDGDKDDGPGSAFLTNRLNGHTRDDAGNVSGDGDRRVEGEWQIIVNPPPNLILEKGDEWQYVGEANRWNRIRNVGATIEKAFDGCAKPIELRRRIHDPMFIEPDKVP